MLALFHTIRGLEFYRKRLVQYLRGSILLITLRVQELRFDKVAILQSFMSHKKLLKFLNFSYIH